MTSVVNSIVVEKKFPTLIKTLEEFNRNYDKLFLPNPFLDLIEKSFVLEPGYVKDECNIMSRDRNSFDAIKGLKDPLVWIECLPIGRTGEFSYHFTIEKDGKIKFSTELFLSDLENLDKNL